MRAEKKSWPKATKAELTERLRSLGYSISPLSSSYLNNLNPGPPYKARSIYVIESDTGLSAFHVDARRDLNFRILQDEVRGDYDVRGVIWEI